MSTFAGMERRIRFIDLFAGIGGIRIPFDELGYECVFSSEWDKAGGNSIPIRTAN